MVKYSNDRAEALLDSAGPGTSRAALSPRHRPARPVRKADEELVVRVSLCAGLFELRVQRGAVKAERRRGHIEGFNADATPC